ncbi:uncharacterized protein LOC141600977 [Silene latifolia]|uniref:uncharacterized protein LOC141600977 n=1 Tax=Silene latifolia TaxID=37657 RepID=UPI003D771119
MKLNPSKCTFGVSSVKFLGYIVTQRGIEAITEQIKAVLQLESPEKPKDMQRLAGKVAALSRFISRSSDKYRLFYDILRKSQKFEWTIDHEQAFRELKHYLGTPSLLSKPEQGEPLFLYLAVTEVEVSAVLVREQDKEQNPVYYVSKSPLPAEIRYTSLEKLPELSGRMSKWSVHLSGYDIRYDPRTAIKSQALAYFMSDFSPAIQNLADKEILTLKGNKEEEVWQMYIDGGSNQKGVGVGLILRSPNEYLIAQAVRCEFKVTNNETEYEALILGNAASSGVRSQKPAATDSKIIAYLKVAKELKHKFRDCKLKQVPRDQNVEADALATLGATFKPTELANIPIAYVLKSSIQKLEEADKG